MQWNQVHSHKSQDEPRPRDSSSKNLEAEKEDGDALRPHTQTRRLSLTLVWCVYMTSGPLLAYKSEKVRD